MKTITKHLTEIILAVVAIMLVVGIVLVLATPIGNFFTGVLDKEKEPVDNNIFQTGTYAIPFTVSLKTNMPAAGTVEFTGDHSGTSVNMDGAGTVTFKATVNSGYKFLGWYQGNTLISSDLEYTTGYNVSGATTLTAKYEEYLAAGLYETGTKTMIMSWNELISSGILASNGKIVSGQEANLAGDLVIADTLTSLPSYAYKNCTALTSVTFAPGSQLTTIGGFGGCTSLESIVIPDSVTSISGQAFQNCTALTSIEIPAGVTSIGSSAFENCTNLKTVYYEGTLEQWCNIMIAGNANSGTGLSGEGPCNNGADLYINGELVVDITIPNTVEIKPNAFTGVTSLKSVTIEDGITKIGNYAFEDCTALISITIPDGVTSIGNSVFKNCTSLTSIMIPDGVTTIDWQAFQGCTSLASITIPAGVTEIKAHAFDDCTILKDVYYLGELADWLAISFANGTSNPCFEGKANLYFNGTLVTEVNIPTGTTTIGDYAFSNCTSLTSVEIPDSVTGISSSAFYLCENLTSVTFGENSQLTTIGDYAFRGCTSLTSIEIPDGVTSLGNYAFSGCTSLISINIPNSVTKISGYTFTGCSNLTSIEIGNGITSINSWAFENCTNLKTVYYEGTLEQWCQITFNNYASSPCHRGADLYIGGTKQTDIIIPDTITEIKDYTFYKCTSLTSVTIPDGVTTIPASAFQGCTSLTSIEIPDGVTSLGNSAFRDCTSLKNVTIFATTPPSISDSIYSSNGTFYGCTALTTITVPKDTLSAYQTAWSSVASKLVEASS